MFGLTPDAAALHLSGGTSADPVRRELLFDASAERFARKWYGTFGWQLFRAASILAASPVGHGPRHIGSEDGPTQDHNPLLARSGPVCEERQGMMRRTSRRELRIAHVVRSDSFAGVERYVCLVAPRLAARGRGSSRWSEAIRRRCDRFMGGIHGDPHRPLGKSP